MTNNRNLGKEGELLAAAFLRKQGYQIIETNWTIGHKEIDIIIKEEEVYIFVEVKTRGTLSIGMPEEGVSKSKMRSVCSAAGFYLEGKKYKDVRFDVVSIYRPPSGETEIVHFKDAYY